jgi:hypothetical protein
MLLRVFTNRTKTGVNTVTATIYFCLLVEIFLDLNSDYVVSLRKKNILSELMMRSSLMLIHKTHCTSMIAIRRLINCGGCYGFKMT